MKMKEVMEACTNYLNLDKSKQQYAAGLIKGFVLAGQLKEDEEMSEEKVHETT